MYRKTTDLLTSIVEHGVHSSTEGMCLAASVAPASVWCARAHPHSTARGRTGTVFAKQVQRAYRQSHLIYLRQPPKNKPVQ